MSTLKKVCKPDTCDEDLTDFVPSGTRDCLLMGTCPEPVVAEDTPK